MHTPNFSLITGEPGQSNHGNTESRLRRPRLSATPFKTKYLTMLSQFAANALSPWVAYKIGRQESPIFMSHNGLTSV